jgi:hypothetical protein
VEGLEKLLALEEIRTLAVRYSQYRDGLHLDELASLFAEDAVCSFGERFGGDVVGRSAIRRHFDGSRHIGGGVPFGTVHAIGTHWIEFSAADRAQGRCYLIDFTTDTRDNPLKFLILYDDQYVRAEGRWLFQHRTLRMIWPERNGTPWLVDQPS